MATSKNLPTAAIVVAVLNLVLFAPCLCCSGGAVVMGSTGGFESGFAASPQQKEQTEKNKREMEKELPNSNIVTLATNVVYVFLSTLMIVAAVGLFLKKPWGRMLCILCCIAIIAFVAAITIYQLTTVIPVANRIAEQQLKDQKVAAPQGLVSGALYGSVIGSALIFGGYPLLAIGLLMTSSVRKAYSSDSADRRDFENDDERRDDYDDRHRMEDDR